MRGDRRPNTRYSSLKLPCFTTHLLSRRSGEQRQTQHAEIMATNRFDPLQPQQSPGWDICSTCGAARRVLGHASSLDRAPAATACVRDWAGNSAGGEPSPTPARPLHERPVQEGMFCAANEFTGQIRARKCVVSSPRHVWTRTRRRGSGTDTGTPARLSWHRRPSPPTPSGAPFRCRDSARPPSDEHGEGTGVFGVAHALRGCDHAMAAGSMCLLEDESERSQRDSVWGSV